MRSTTNRADTHGQVHRTGLDTAHRPSDVLRLFRHRRRLVALIGAWHCGNAIIGWDPVRVLSGDAFDELDQPEIPAADAFGGGWIGAWGFRLTGDLHSVSLRGARPVTQPEHRVAYYEHVLRLRNDRWWLESLSDAQQHAAVLADVVATLDAPAPTPGPCSVGEFTASPGAGAHRQIVTQAVNRIRSGELFQVNLAMRFQAELSGDPLDVFCRGVEALTPAYAAYVADEAGAIMSMSPELFLRRHGRDVVTSPIKGTAPLDSSPDLLLSSAKDRAENLIAVDLIRSELADVCVPGSVRVPAVARLERHSVWHLVSDITGRLPAGMGDGQLLSRLFPPGSIAGVPKARALELIGAWESTSREAYTGAIGYVSPCRGMELNVAIRTFETDGATIWLGAGGGVVSGSNAQAELDECWAKARPLIEAIGGSLSADGRHAQRVSSKTRTRAKHATPSHLAIFETIRVEDGHPLDVDAHLFRLETSARAVFGAGSSAIGVPSLPDDTRQQILDAAYATTGVYRMRVDVHWAGGRMGVSIATYPFEGQHNAGPDGRAQEPGHWVLVPRVLESGHGEHKWADRSRLDPSPPEGQELLLLDTDRTVLEGGRSSVFIVDTDGLHTPPLDGRILPGCARARVIEACRSAGLVVRERRLTVDDLAAAGEVFVTNSLRGVIPVREAEGIGHWPPGPVTSWIRSATFSSSTCPPPSLSAAASVLLLHRHDPFVGSLTHQLRTAGADVTVMHADDIPNLGSLMRKLRAATHVLLAADSVAGGIDQSLVHRLAECTTVLGIGAGANALATAFGYRTRPLTDHARKRHVDHDHTGVFRGLPSPVTVGCYLSHVIEPAADPVVGPASSVAHVTARSGDGAIMGLRHQDLPVEAVLFRPESILTPQGRQIADNFLAAKRA